MKKICIVGGKNSNIAIGVITSHLENLGHLVTRSKEDDYEVGLSWGRSYNGPKPFLNKDVNQFDKFNCFEAFRKANVLCPTTFPIDGVVAKFGAGDCPRPWLARKTHHSKGKDIVVCKTAFEISEVCGKGEHAFFSVYIPIDTEYRVWVFQDKAFATYEKVYTGQGEYKGFMRNRRFGFEFSKRDNLVGDPTIEGPCIKAVKALGMDLGAVDILKGKDGKFYVLEVNSMPHITNTRRSCGVRLAKQVSMWAEEQ